MLFKTDSREMFDCELIKRPIHNLDLYQKMRESILLLKKENTELKIKLEQLESKQLELMKTSNINVKKE